MSADPAPPRRRGRPPLPPGRVKKEPLVFRTTKTLKDALTAAAEASGRSLAAEIEFRLAGSLAADGSRVGAEALRSRIVLEVMREFETVAQKALDHRRSLADIETASLSENLRSLDAVAARSKPRKRRS